MSRGLKYALSLIVGFCVLFGWSSTGAAAQTGAIHVVVFEGDGTPAEGVAVRVPDAKAAGVTNRHGGLMLRVPEGDWAVEIGRGVRRGVARDVTVRGAMTTEVVAEWGGVGGASLVADVEAPRESAAKAATGKQADEPTGPPGTVEGRVVSAEDQTPVVGARVLVRGSRSEATTGEEGRFTLELPEGRWDLTVIHSKYSTSSRSDVTVTPEQTTDVSFKLTPAAVRMGTVRVTIPRIEGGTVELMEQRRDSSAATDVIGAEQFSKTGDSTAAGALKRVTGLTVVGGKYVYVRGLGSRYAATLLNGATLPSPQPEKRVVPLDLFPTGILESVTIQKTYTPDMPGNFGGGVVRMETRSYPEEFSASLGLSMGGATDTTLRRGATYQGGSLDWLGVDDGTRALPDRVERATDGKALTKKDRFGKGNYTGEELEAIGEAMPNIWNLDGKTVLPDMAVDAEIGDSFELGGETTAGFLLAASYDSSHDVDRWVGKTVKQGNALTVNNEYDFFETTDTVTTNAILAAGLDFDEDNSLKLTALVNRVTDDEQRRYEGFYSDHGGDILVTRLRWLERQMFVNQLEGEHTLASAADLTVDWHYVYSRASRTEPDRRLYRYDWEDQVDRYVLSDRPEGNNRLWSDLTDNNHDGSLAVTWPFEVWGGREANFETGLSAVYKDREVSTRRFKFFSTTTDYDVMSQRPEQVFSEANIGPDSLFELRETTRSTDNYNGRQILLGGWAMLEVPLTEDLEVSAGARIEHSRQRVETVELFSDEASVGKLVTTDVLPALNVTWAFAEDMQLRGAVSRTVNRPNFRELSSSAFTDVVGGQEFRGNPDLNRANLTHVDARWEWYPDRGDSMSVAAFYKDFNNPIEITYEPGATPIVRPTNIENARNFGVEFEARTGLDILGAGLRDFYVAGNISYIQSSIRIDPASSEAEILTHTERPLQGQSPYVLNLQFGYDNVESRTRATLLYNVSGPRITQVGIYGIPDVFEDPFHTVDATFSQRFDGGWKIGAKAKNLLNLEHTYRQGSIITRRETRGRAFSVSVTKSW